MIKTNSIAFRFAFAILTSCVVIFLIVFGYNYALTRKIIEKNIRSSADNLVLRTLNSIDAILRPIERVPQNIVYTLESTSYNKETVMNMLSTAVANNQEIYGAAAAFEPYTIDKNSSEFAPYFYKENNKVWFKYLEGDYKYFSWDWYQIPKEIGRPRWSDAYFDEGGGNITMATYSVPMHSKVGDNKKFIGVITADISLTWLQDIISSIKIGKTGYGFLISKSGRIITHPVKDLVMNETIFDIAESRDDPGLRSIGKEMISGKSGFVQSKDIVTGKKCWLAYAPLRTSGWSLGVIFPQDELMADITKLNGTVLSLGTIGFIFLLVVIILISRSITSPIMTLHKTTKDIARGNLDFVMPAIKSSDEVGELAQSFLYMRTALKKYIKELTETTASKERMESELRVAHDIQLSLVPKTFPPFPDRPEFDIYAVIEPAKEVGGDFYDFFFIDASRFCIVIGDVVGKGVPAALLMAVIKTLIKTYAIESKDPSITLTKANEEICRNNSSSMFISIFIGILDTINGELIYTNAGHNPPVFVKKAKYPIFIGHAEDMAVGLDDNTSYNNKKLMLSEGDMLCMYTDGVTEAFNSKHEQFSEERLLLALNNSSKESLNNIVKNVVKEIRTFTGSHPQSDDITMLFIKTNLVK